MLVRPIRSRLDQWAPAPHVLLVIAAILPYANTFFNSFISDDIFQIVENPYVRSFSHLREIFTSSVWSFQGGHSNYYRPLMTLGYLLCFKCFGLSAHGFHLINILLHGATVYALFSVTKRVFADRSVAFAASLIFALQPIHTESVAWIAAVTDVELTFLYLMTFALFLGLNTARTGWTRQWLLQTLVMVSSFVLTLLAKEQAVTLPLLTTLYEHVCRSDRFQTTPGQKLLRYGPLWLTVLVYLPVRVLFLGRFAPVTRSPDLRVQEIVFSAVALSGQYIAKLLWPVHLSAYYLFQKSVRPVEGAVLFGAVLWLIACWFFWHFRKRCPGVSFGIAWLFVTLTPVLNPQWLGFSVFEERYLYLPSVGFCWLAAAALKHTSDYAAQPQRPRCRVALRAGVVILAMLCTLRIVTRNRDWRDEVVFYTSILPGLPASSESDQLRVNLALAYERQQAWGPAELELRQVLKSQADHVWALNDLGVALMNQGRFWEALDSFRRVIQLDAKNPSGYVNLGLDYLRLKMNEEAEEAFQDALSVDHSNEVALRMLRSFRTQSHE